MLVLYIAGGIVVGLWCWNALQRWAWSPEPRRMTPEMRQAIKELADASPRKRPDGGITWKDSESEKRKTDAS